MFEGSGSSEAAVEIAGRQAMCLAQPLLTAQRSLALVEAEASAAAPWGALAQAVIFALL
jgi:hypothetical protein